MIKMTMQEKGVTRAKAKEIIRQHDAFMIQRTLEMMTQELVAISRGHVASQGRSILQMSLAQIRTSQFAR
ncbi:hypothetical protein [Ralstonia phage RSF1]|uniref:Uncharacterized protein n=1 Tax=Ralstonia phage RSF1 TaxID=1689679 RepID=A0A0K2QQL6_9CAUD|nr:hypothetical protein AVU11_agp20 [Ralstonia phage RSF1]BAS04885.2 hypothetical protein [Ralstonia phage RSF1]